MSDYKQTRDAAGNVTSQYGQMLRNLDDDLVERLRDNTRIHDDKRIDRLEAADRIEELGVAYVQADHIAELEAKLAKAVEALELALELADNDLVDFSEYGLSCDADINEHYRTTLAALKGQDDE